MTFAIACETFYRLAMVSQKIPPDMTAEDALLYGMVRLENHNGNAFAIATNRKVAAIEYLGPTTNPDGSAHVIVDAVILAQLAIEKAHNSFLYVTAIPALNMATAKTTFGWNYPGNALCQHTHPVFNEWRNWAPAEVPKKSRGALTLCADMLSALNASSLSGQINFPEFIDTTVPVVLRDEKNPNWVGLFHPTQKREDTGEVYTVQPATLPKWWKL